MNSGLNRKLDWAIKKLETAGFEEDSELYYNIAHVVTLAKRHIKEIEEDQDVLKLRMEVALRHTNRRNGLISAWVKSLRWSINDA